MNDTNKVLYVSTQPAMNMHTTGGLRIDFRYGFYETSDPRIIEYLDKEIKEEQNLFIKHANEVQEVQWAQMKDPQGHAKAVAKVELEEEFNAALKERFGISMDELLSGVDGSEAGPQVQLVPTGSDVLSALDKFKSSIQSSAGAGTAAESNQQ